MTDMIISGPIRATRDGQLIENLIVVSDDSTPAIDVNGVKNVVIRNVIVKHTLGPGIRAHNADGIRIDTVEVVNTAAQAYGAHQGDGAAGRVNIEIYRANGAVVDNVRLEKGSSGILAMESERVALTRIEGHDFRGPYPRGQLVQFDKCTDPVLDDFSVINPGDTSWTEDAVNAYSSLNPTIRNGYIDGINSPTGIGVLIENGEGGHGGLIESVDVRHWVNGAFMAATQSSDVVFRDVRAYDGIASHDVAQAIGRTGVGGALIPSLEDWAGDNFRGLPTSGQQAFLAYNVTTSPTYIDARYSALVLNDRVAWGDMNVEGGFSAAETIPREPMKANLPWDLPNILHRSPICIGSGMSL